VVDEGLVYILEKDHAPVEWGRVEFSGAGAPSEAIARQGAAFARSYLRKKIAQAAACAT